MKTIGFVTSQKENENRRAILPRDLKKIINTNFVFIEEGYGKVLNIQDEAYKEFGCHICSREQALKQDIICDPKIGDASYLEKLNNQIVFGWVHAVQNKPITDKLIKGKLTAVCWEDMFLDGRHVFWRNNELAGEAAIMHAFQCFGIMPYNAKVALLGRGNVANGALKILTLLGANVTTYSRNLEKLFRKEMFSYDVVVNAILWDTNRTDHIIYAKDLLEWKKVKNNAMIIDISCDFCGGIETSIPTTIENPIYCKNGVIHYVVDHTPTLFYKTTSFAISSEVSKYIDMLIEGKHDVVIKNAIAVENGNIIDKRIIAYQDKRIEHI